MIKVTALIISFLFFGNLLGYTQPGSVDSLKIVLKNSGSDTSRVNLLNKLSLVYLTNRPNEALSYADEALTLARVLQFTHGEMIALNRVGENEFRQGNYASAVDHTTRSLKMAEKLGDSTGMAMAYRVLGIIYTYGLKQYDIALQYQLSALKIFEKKKDKHSMASFYGNITWIYASMNKNLPEAHRLARLGLHLADSLNENRLLSYNYNSQSLIFLREDQPDSSLWYSDLSIQMAEVVKDRAVIAYNKTIKGNAYLLQRDYAHAIEMFEQAVAEGRSLNMDGVIKDANEGLATSYAATGNFMLAYEKYRLATRLQDSLVNWETTQKILLTKLEFEEEKRDAKIAELETAKDQAFKEKVIYGILTGVIFLSMIAVIILVARNNRQRKETNELLEKKNEEIAKQNIKLQEANNIKDKFFSIIGHDLRSPLASLKGLLGMVIRNEISEQEFKIFAAKLHHLVIGTNETLENLLQWSHSQMDGWTYSPTTLSLQPLIEKCTVLFIEEATIKNIALLHQVDTKETVHAEPNQIELIIRNLIHNAIKFTSEGGTVQITANRVSDFLEVCVTDTGMGMSAEQVSNLFQHQTHSARGTSGERGMGLGLQLCKEMIEKNGGKISVTSELGKGSTFHVFLKTCEAA